jgi:hypothetical protein
MNDLAPLGVGLIFAAVVALVIIAIVYSVKAARKRREALQQFANENGFRFDPADDRALPGTLAEFGTFNRGSDRRAYNTLSGDLSVDSRPVAIRIGDYRFTTESGSGKDRQQTTHRLSYLHARLAFACTATLTVRRENFFDKIGGAIGFEDINFESAEFSRKFHVKSDDKKFTYDLFDPRMIEWYLPSNPPTLEIIGRDLLLTMGGVWTPEDMCKQLEWAKAFIEHWPAHIVDRLGA